MMTKRILSACMSSFSRGDGKTGFGGYSSDDSIADDGDEDYEDDEVDDSNGSI